MNANSNPLDDFVWKSLKRLALAVLALLSLACSPRAVVAPEIESFRSALPQSAPFLTKGRLLSAKGEGSPFVWGGRLMLAAFHRGSGYSNDSWQSATHVELWDVESDTLLTTVEAPLGCGTALVVDGRLFLFGTSNWDRTGNSISVVSSSDLTEWTEPSVIFTAPASQTIYNVTIVREGSGFLIGYEICEKGKVCFNVRFLRSSSPDSGYVRVEGAALTPGFYTACPTLFFADGWYYSMYLSAFRESSGPLHLQMSWSTLISRSRDLITWEQSPQPVVWAHDGGDHYFNASDIDLVEHEGRVRGIYGNGPQVSFPGAEIGDHGVREIIYEGGLNEMLGRFF